MGRHSSVEPTPATVPGSALWRPSPMPRTQKLLTGATVAPNPVEPVWWRNRDVWAELAIVGAGLFFVLIALFGSIVYMTS